MLHRLLLVFLLVGPTAHATDLPPYFKEALNRFNPDIPLDLAYTITTKRGEGSSVERYDPALPEERQWTLLQCNGRPATAKEISRNGSYRIATAPSQHATFRRDDIDRNSLRLLREDTERAEYQCRFREDLNDPLLYHLELRLTVLKKPAAIEQYVLQLTGAYSPVLTVKMLDLRVEATFSLPAGDRPALPRQVTSRFRGRVWLFKSVEEDVQTDYADFTPVIPFSPPPTAGRP